MRPETQSRKLSFRMTEEEYNELVLKLGTSCFGSMSNYLRKMALNGYIICIDLSWLKDTLTQLRRIGNGINQIARVANSTGSIYAHDMQILNGYMDEVRTITAQVLKKISEIVS